MSEPAKDEAELIERMAEGLHNDYDLNLPEKYRGSFRTVRPPESCDIIVGTVTAVLAAIRAAGWAVVPVEPTFHMENEGSVAMVKIGLIPLPGEVAEIYHAILAAAPGVKL